eukprot:8189011-Prorocentrum_lima.AAC.1
MPQPGGAVPQLAEARESPFGNQGEEGREARKSEDFLVGQMGVGQGGPGRLKKPEGKEERDMEGVQGLWREAGPRLCAVEKARDNQHVDKLHPGAEREGRIGELGAGAEDTRFSKPGP